MARTIKKNINFSYVTLFIVKKDRLSYFADNP